MSRTLFIDPFGGAAGDMLLGALVDLGANPAELRRVLAGLHLAGWRLDLQRDRHQGLAGTRARVTVEVESHPARRLADIEHLLTAATLPASVAARSRECFRRLFEAEAAAHGVPPAEVHLHELSAVDAVIDIVGTCAAVDLLDVQRVVSGPVPVGRGTIATAHGLLPVPGPAVVSLLRGVPLAAHGAEGEMTTPTGATLLVTLAERFGALPAGRLIGAGVGLGTRTFPGVPNVLRALLLEEDAAPLAARSLAIVETTVDDVTGEALRHLLDLLCDAGALDAWCLAGTGRKGRPVTEVRALCEPDRVAAITGVLFAEGATLGARVLACARPEAERHEVMVSTPFGDMPVKVGVFAGRVVSAKPGHDACAAAARGHSVRLATVVQAARAVAPVLGSPWPGVAPGDA